MKKVSVIVPVYKVEKYLNKCLESLVNQTLQDIEIIVVNDGSPDNSQSIIDNFKQKYPETITYIPTMEELECINFEKYFKTYAPFVLYTIREMDTVISNELDMFTEDEIARAKEVRKYLSAIQFKYTKFEE